MGLGGNAEKGRGRGERTFSLGNRVSIAGSESNTPPGVSVIGHVLNSWFSSAWAPSRAVAARSLSRLLGVERESGFGSAARRRPRSKV